MAAAARPSAARNDLRSLLTTGFDAPGALLTASGTHALQIALVMARDSLAPGRPVALPAYSCYDVAAAAVGASVDVVFYDLDPLTLAPDLESFRTALGAGAGAAVVGNLFGFPIEWDVIRAECRVRGTVLIEDCAQGLGTGAGGGGVAGDLTVLSFGRGKGWTGGGGGALLARGPAAERIGDRLAARTWPRPGGLSSIRTLVELIAQWTLGRPSLYGIPSSLTWLGLGETRYRPATQPMEMGALTASVATRHAGAARTELASRSVVAGWWDRAWETLIAESDGLTRCRPVPRAAAGYHRYPFLASDEAHAWAVERACRAWGANRSYPISLPDLGVLPPGSTPLAGSRRLAASLLTFPTHRMVRRHEPEAALRAARLSRT